MGVLPPPRARSAGGGRARGVHHPVRVHDGSEAQGDPSQGAAAAPPAERVPSALVHPHAGRTQAAALPRGEQHRRSGALPSPRGRALRGRPGRRRDPRGELLRGGARARARRDRERVPDGGRGAAGAAAAAGRAADLRRVQDPHDRRGGAEAGNEGEGGRRGRAAAGARAGARAADRRVPGGAVRGAERRSAPALAGAVGGAAGLRGAAREPLRAEEPPRARVRARRDAELHPGLRARRGAARGAARAAGEADGAGDGERSAAARGAPVPGGARADARAADAGARGAGVGGAGARAAAPRGLVRRRAGAAAARAGRGVPDRRSVGEVRSRRGAPGRPAGGGAGATAAGDDPPGAAARPRGVHGARELDPAGAALGVDQRDDRGGLSAADAAPRRRAGAGGRTRLPRAGRDAASVTGDDLADRVAEPRPHLLEAGAGEAREPQRGASAAGGGVGPPLPRLGPRGAGAELDADGGVQPASPRVRGAELQRGAAGDRPLDAGRGEAAQGLPVRGDPADPREPRGAARVGRRDGQDLHGGGGDRGGAPGRLGAAAGGGGAEQHHPAVARRDRGGAAGLPGRADRGEPVAGRSRREARRGERDGLAGRARAQVGPLPGG